MSVKIKAKIPRAFMETVSQIERLPALTLTSVVTGLEVSTPVGCLG
jgi:hypothetical protein